MSNEAKTLKIKELAEGLLSADPSIFLVRVHIRPINNISVYVDGDQGVTIDKCVKLNRALYKQIVEEGVCPDGEFALEVSSPGVDEPLVLERQYTKNLGRVVEVTDLEGKLIEGKLLSATAEGIEIEEEKGKGKKKEVIKHQLPFSSIKSTVVKIIF
jgi:ribosome maturation factor RimP